MTAILMLISLGASLSFAQDDNSGKRPSPFDNEPAKKNLNKGPSKSEKSPDDADPPETDAPSSSGAADAKAAADAKRSPRSKLPPEELKAEVTKLAEQLDDNKSAIRDAAEAKLLELGPAVMEYLPSIGEGASPEWQMRIERIRQSVSEKEYQEYTLPSTVTMKGEITGESALQQLSEQTGNVISLENVQGLDRKVMTEFEDTPFWEAIDEILDQLDLTIAPGDGEAIRLVPRAETAPLRIAAANYSGVFRIEPVSVDKSVSFIQPANSNCQVHLLLAWEPRLRPIQVKFELDNIEMICDDGEILLPFPAQPTDFLPISGSQMQVALEFNLPSREAKRVLRWNGKIKVSIPGKPVTLEFTELDNAQNQKLTSGSLNVVLEKARKNRGVHELLVNVSLNQSGQTNDSFRGWATMHEAFLENDKGTKIENVGWSTTRMTNSSVGLSYLFELDKGFEGCKFVYRAPGSIVEQIIEYSIEDIPLP